ncbi:hypothetical protein CCACVL1_00454 [Corchorus capsularis]|uniref:Uncharacterized protein n=1 Tax=Corchorus capsularis TaxID=210143 RepID=A0A1R3KWQ5_COCAP|nr:hypothetical protein CCACVL1_00454 [Corchorus capsularis]
MNGVLMDSPLEALAFNYVSFGIFTIINNLWTWVAVITAAVSFWRIRASGAATLSCSVKRPDHKTSTCIINRAQDESHEAEEKPTTSASVSAPSAVTEMMRVPSTPLLCNDAVVTTKGTKFRLSVYYEHDGKSTVTGMDGKSTVTEWYDGDGDCKEWWERVLSLRNGERGWYSFQDLTVINGNVVRLWDDFRRVKYSSSCAVW